MIERAFRLVLAMCYLLLSSRLLLANPINPSSSSAFELVNGMVIVQAEMDGKLANFILDTGSPMMILNEKTTDSPDFQANSLQGGITGRWRNITEFKWAGVRKFDLKALTTDISVLELVTERPIAGLIGYDFLEGFELVLDFDHLLVMLVPAGATAKLEGWILKSEVPFRMAGHLPVIEAKIGEVTLRFGLDTGANTNLLNAAKAKELDATLASPISDAGILGMGGDSFKTYVSDVEETSIGGLTFKDMRFVFSDISHLRNLMDYGVDGLLGFPFFKAGKFSLNYAKRTVSIWE